MPKSLSPHRFWITHSIVILSFLLIIYQLVQLSIYRKDSLREVADRQHLLRIESAPLRGQILDRHGKELATNLKVPSIYAVPRMIKKADRTDMAKRVGKILDLGKTFVRQRLSRDKAFVWIKRRVSYDQSQAIKNIKSPALGIIEESKRFYPQGDLLAQVLGFVNIDNKGMEGVELQANRDLQGRAGQRLTKRDALGREIKAFEMKAIPSINGNQIHLTIDQYIQYLTERALERAFVKWKAKAGWAVVMNPKTGEILALANRPTYDPNFYGQALAENRRNRVITDMYEPGSVFKIVAASATLNEGVADSNTVVDCEQGEYNYYRSYVLHDVHPYGLLNFRDVIVKSSNIGTVKLAKMIKPEVFQDYVNAFGFGKKTGIDIPGEASGFTRPPRKWSKTSPYNIPIGHEVMVTAIQMATAMSVIANGGSLVKPYVISKVVDPAGVTLSKSHPHVKRTVLRPEVAAMMRDILRGVVEEGTGKRARIEGIPVGGKTGTAQKVLPNGRGYSQDNFMSSFVGFAPVDDPRLVMVVTLDDPGPKYYGGTVAAPVFKEVIEPALLSVGYIPEDSVEAA